MLLIFAIAGLAAVAVVTYNKLKEQDPDGAVQTVTGVRQLAAVVLICARAIEAVLDALQSAGRRRSPATGIPSAGRSYGWPEEGEGAKMSGTSNSTSDPRRLPVRRGGPVRPRPDQRFDVAAQVVAHGNQDIRVRAVTAAVSTTRHGSIAVRVGRLIVYLEDRDALAAFTDAFGRAGEVGDAVFGPLPEPAAYRRHR